MVILYCVYTATCELNYTALKIVPCWNFNFLEGAFEHMHTHVRIQNGVYFPLRSHFRALFSHARMPHEQVNKLSFYPSTYIVCSSVTSTGQK